MTSPNYALIGAILAVAFVGLAIISYLWLPFLPFVEERQAGEDTIEQTYDAESAIQDYRWFRSQYEEIQAQRNQIEHVRDEETQFHETYGDDPAEWSRTAETRHGRIHERITGNQQHLETLVAEYNARSSDATRSLFKCHLPYQVDERFRIRGPPGSDDAEQPQDKYVDDADPDKEPPEPEQCDALPQEASP